jgi:hypothetical protein
VTGRSSARSSIPTVNYHGAHKPPVDAPPVDRWEGPSCTAFVHDLLASPTLPDEFDQCDVLVTDLPWQVGFDTFNKRANITDGRTYGTFMVRVSELVESTRTPLYLVTGRHALVKLPTPDVVLPMRLNEDEAVAVGYRPGNEADGRYGVAPEFLHTLAQRYDIAGDFCCGYGRTARFFLRSGKKAVMSDVNPTCIGYIAQNATAWAGRLA